MLRVKPKYTSMFCSRESTEWSASDEVYAIFVGLKWDLKSYDKPRVFVRRTRVYTDVDERENKGQGKEYDDKALTKTGKYEAVEDFSKMLILVQCMEHDQSSPTRIHRALAAVMEKKYGSERALERLRDMTKAKVVSEVKGLMTDTIKEAKWWTTNDFQRFMDNFQGLDDDPDIPTLIQILKLAAYASSRNEDDIVGGPQQLPCSKAGREFLEFSSSGQGTYTFRFSILHKTE